jgi:hypothetical protein
MKTDNRKTISDELKYYDPCRKDHEYIEITEWTNSEGWDIDINGKLISLHSGELDAINYLIKTLEYGRFCCTE